MKLGSSITELLMEVELPIIATLCNQFNMCALLNNATILHDNDLIKWNGLYDAMGDKD